jgi:hypothetical protein
VARLVPAPPDDDFRSTRGKYRDKMVVHGDLLTTGRKWNAKP